VAEWLYEAGIGENRAALIEGGEILEACVEPHSTAIRAGTILPARLRANRIAEMDSGAQALLDAVPAKLTEGAHIVIEISREALSEPGKAKRAKARLVPPDSEPRDGPTLLERISTSGIRVATVSPHDEDQLENCGWSECLEQASSGVVTGEKVALRISLTPAMTLIDVDGTHPPLTLAIEGVKAAGAAIIRLGLSGSIGIDLPTLESKPDRILAAAALRGPLRPPFEATAINGFGFMQIIVPRRRASLCELLQYDRPTAQARALLRRAQRWGLTGAVTLVVPSRIAAVLEDNRDWLDQLARHCGGAVSLRVEPQLGMDGAYVQA
jgi:hypothetical protein